MSTEVLATVEKIANGVIREHAAQVDKSGQFPEASLAALRSAGLLGLLSAKEVGGLGLSLRVASQAVERIAQECASTAMVLTMHYSGVAVLEKHATESVRKQVASGQHLSTLAFSEVGSRSHFWAAMGSATVKDGNVTLNGKKSFATSAHNATAYVWSSKPVSAQGASTLWLVPRTSKGITQSGDFDGLGLRGNDSTGIVAEGVVVPADQRLGPDGGGLDIMLGVVLPVFNVLSSACGVGIMEGATAAAVTHAAGTKHEHLGASLAELPTVRAFLARMRIATDRTRTLWLDTLDALERGRPDAQLRVLECKACAGETATEVLDLAMRVCGGAAFRREVGVERRFRDARAGTVMAPTTDQLYDFIGKAITGLPLM